MSAQPSLDGAVREAVGQETFDTYREQLSSTARDHGAHGALAAVSSDLDWRDRAREVLERLARSGITFDAEDLRREVGPPPSANAVGSIFLAGSRSGRIVTVGIARARRITRHASVLRRWRGAEWEETR